MIISLWWSLLFAAHAHAAVVTDSYLGYAAKPVPARTQFLKGKTVNLHLRLADLSDPSPIVVEWYWKGTRVKRSVIRGRRVHHWSNISITARPGQWTVYATDKKGKRSHHFVVQ